MEVVLKYFDEFTPQQIDHLTQLEQLYKYWNEQINVISRKDIDALYSKHVLHSLAIAALFPFAPGLQILDVGTGGGFPGIPLAIFYPEVHFCLADSIGKKIKVVSEVASALGLSNVTTHHGRVEEVKNRQFHYVVSRAVAPLADLWRWTNDKISTDHHEEEYPNGLICLKGGDLEKEIQESGLQKVVQAWAVQDIFPEPEFEEKFILYVPKV